MITIVDYGMGNLLSIQNMFRRIGALSEITGDPGKIHDAAKILLPGVGAFDAAMEKIASSNLLDVLNKKALVDKVPVLGICLGMQLLTKDSEEGLRKGLGWIDAHTIKFNFGGDTKLKIPHMSWNQVEVSKESALVKDLAQDARFYFVHSYHVVAENTADVLMTSTYGYPFHAAIQHENIYGAQFHPEKSHKYGMKLLQNFASL